MCKIGNRILTIPNFLSFLRLSLIPLFAWSLFNDKSSELTPLILIFSGFSDWADGKVARLFIKQASHFGEILDPLVDRIYIIAIPFIITLHKEISWWLVIILLSRDIILAATLKPLLNRGITTLPVTYMGKVATFLLMIGFPGIILEQYRFKFHLLVITFIWKLIEGAIVMYIWSGGVYLIQTFSIFLYIPKLIKVKKHLLSPKMFCYVLYE